MRLLIVIVNYRTASLAIDCLHSLAGQISALPETQVVIVDNASSDDSAERLQNEIKKHNWCEWARVMPLERNGGFAAGNNAAIGPALAGQNPPEYVLLLNPDTVVRPGAIQTLVDFMEASPRVGIAGSRLEHPDGRPQISAFRFHSTFSELESGLRLGVVSRLLRKWVVAQPVPDRACPTDWVAGASMIIRQDVFDAIGLLDERYFMYFEEVDFCLRASRAGWSCWYVPSSHVVHLVGQSSGVTDLKQAQKRRPAYWFASRHRFFMKNYGRVRTVLANLYWAIGFAIFRVRRVVQRKPDTDPQYLLRDFLRYNFLWSRRIEGIR